MYFASRAFVQFRVFSFENLGFALFVCQNSSFVFWSDGSNVAFCLLLLFVFRVVLRVVSIEILRRFSFVLRNIANVCVLKMLLFFISFPPSLSPTKALPFPSSF